MREAPSLVLASLLLERGAKIKVYDPVSMEEAKKDLGKSVDYCNSLYETVENADAVILITEWSEFRLPDWDLVGELINQKVIFDGRNLYDKKALAKRGFAYYGIGV